MIFNFSNKHSKSERKLIVNKEINFRIKKKKTLWHLFMDGVQLPQGYSHFEEAVYSLSFSSQKFLIKKCKLHFVLFLKTKIHKTEENAWSLWNLHAPNLDTKLPLALKLKYYPHTHCFLRHVQTHVHAQAHTQASSHVQFITHSKYFHFLLCFFSFFLSQQNTSSN